MRTPRALSQQMTARPTGPQPSTIATSFFDTSPRLTACSATAMGSVRAATSGREPVGHDEGQRLLGEHLLGVPTGRQRRQPGRVHVAVDRADSGKTATWAPSRNSLRTPRPRSRTSPTNSWPITVGVERRMNWP